MWLRVLDRLTVDQLSRAQEECLHKFLLLATEHNIDIFPAPRVHERHQRISRLCGVLAATGIGLGSLYFKLLDQDWKAWLLIVTGVGTLLTSWYRYGWSGRLYRKYLRCGTALSIRRRKDLVAKTELRDPVARVLTYPDLTAPWSGWDAIPYIVVGVLLLCLICLFR